MADNKQIKSKREAFGERLKAKYPDKEYADDEALFGQIGDDYDEYESQLGGYKDREKRLTDLLVKDPHSAQFITDMAQGKDPWSALIKRIGIDGVKAMLEDPEKIDEYAASNRDYVARLAKSEELEKEWEQNMQETLAMLERKQQELGLSDDEVDAAADWVRDLANDALLGKITEDTFNMAMNALNHDKDVAEADREGEIRGRNSKVEAQLRRAKEEGDGTVALGGANNAAGGGTKRGSLFELASGAS